HSGQRAQHPTPKIDAVHEVTRQHHVAAAIDGDGVGSLIPTIANQEGPYVRPVAARELGDEDVPSAKTSQHRRRAAEVDIPVEPPRYDDVTAPVHRDAGSYFIGTARAVLGPEVRPVGRRVLRDEDVEPTQRASEGPAAATHAPLEVPRHEVVAAPVNGYSV